MRRVTGVRGANACAEAGNLVNDEWRIESSNPLRIFLPLKTFDQQPWQPSRFFG